MRIDDAFTADTIGVVFSRTGFHERAVPLYRRAVELDPAPANFHYNLGAALQFAGDFPGAEAAYRSTIEREQVNALTIVGDAFGRPLVDQLHRRRYDLSSLRLVTSGGAVQFLSAIPAIERVRFGQVTAYLLSSPEFLRH